MSEKLELAINNISLSNGVLTVKTDAGEFTTPLHPSLDFLQDSLNALAKNTLELKVKGYLEVGDKCTGTDQCSSSFRGAEFTFSSPPPKVEKKEANQKPACSVTTTEES